MAEMQPCRECSTATDDACVRCERPACAEHFFDQEYLGLCQPCADELEADPRPLLQWPYPVRRINPAWEAGATRPVHVPTADDDTVPQRDEGP